MDFNDYLKILREKYDKMILSKEETAHELGVSQATIDRLRYAGKISAKKVLGKVMFKIDTVADFLAK
jgi:predicted transcriptional regulator